MIEIFPACFRWIRGPLCALCVYLTEHQWFCLCARVCTPVCIPACIAVCEAETVRSFFCVSRLMFPSRAEQPGRK